MHRTKNTSKKRRTPRGILTFPAEPVLPHLAGVVVDLDMNDPYMTVDDLVILNPLTLVAGITWQASVRANLLTGGVILTAIATNVSGAQMAFPQTNVRYGIMPV